MYRQAVVVKTGKIKKRLGVGGGGGSNGAYAIRLLVTYFLILTFPL